MSGTVSPGTPAVGNDPTGVTPRSDAGEQTPGSTPPAVPPPASNEPDIYDAAFKDFMGPNAKDPETAPSSEHLPPKGTPEDPAPTAESQGSGKEPDGTAASTQLTGEQIQLLKRQHIEPEMVAGWTEAQRTAYFENAQKREADQTTSYKKLSEQLEQLSKRVEQSGESPDPKAGEGEKDKGNPPTTFADEAKRVSDQLIEDFGPEMGEVGKLMATMGQRLDEATAQIQATGGRIDTTENGSKLMNQVIVELTLDNAISNLVGDYPSLSKDAVRQQVIDKFESDWKSEGSKHRTGEGPILNRVRAAIAEAAKSELGTKTESAAQVALANTNKERLKQQPIPGHGKGQARPKTEDEIYDNAFNETLGAEMKR